MKALLLLAAFVAASAHASSVERFNDFVNSTRSARATFEQKVYDRGGKLTQEAQGTFVFVRPGRFRWVYEKPAEQLIVGDGERVWIYDRELEQVTVRKLPNALGSTPAALLAGSSDIRAAFELSDAGQRDGLEWLQAIPREREAGFDRILIGFGAQGPQAMELLDHFGQRTVLRFSDFERNPSVDPAMFTFKPPPGADVLGEP